MSYILGEDRGQVALLPAAIEDYVAADAPVRVTDAFVDGPDVTGPGRLWNDGVGLADAKAFGLR